MSDKPLKDATALSEEPTAYAVICLDHGQTFMTEAEYDRQVRCPDVRWTCPRCGEESPWDDDNYESVMFGNNPEGA